MYQYLESRSECAAEIFRSRISGYRRSFARKLMSVPFRSLLLRSPSIVRSKLYVPKPTEHRLASSKKRASYYEERKPPGWWRRQDFDDKMTYVVGLFVDRR